LRRVPHCQQGFVPRHFQLRSLPARRLESVCRQSSGGSPPRPGKPHGFYRHYGCHLGNRGILQENTEWVPWVYRGHRGSITRPRRALRFADDAGEEVSTFWFQGRRGVSALTGVDPKRHALRDLPTTENIFVGQALRSKPWLSRMTRAGATGLVLSTMGDDRDGWRRAGFAPGTNYPNRAG